ncbi:MAG: type IV pilus modification PilV family protein [Patescibacteria group bacterium]
MIIFSHPKKPAFSLIEIMVIISIVLVGMLGVMSLLLQNLKAQSINKNRFVAYQMAQEGIETVRLARDTYAVNAEVFLLAYPYGEYSYSYQTALTPMTADDQMAVCIDADGFYNDYLSCENAASKSTIFRRKLILSHGVDDGGNQFLTVKSEVYWMEKEKEDSYTLETQLYDWYTQ